MCVPGEVTSWVKEDSLPHKRRTFQDPAKACKEAPETADIGEDVVCENIDLRFCRNNLNFPAYERGLYKDLMSSQVLSLNYF